MVLSLRNTVSLLFLCCVAAQSSNESLLKNECSPDLYPPTMAASKLTKLTLPSNYKASVIFTDWIAKVTTRITEVSKGGSKGTVVKTRNDPLLHYISTSERTLLRNGTNGACSVFSGSSPITLPASVNEMLGVKNVTSVEDLLKAVTAYGNANDGYLVGSRVLSGVEGARWISCLNGTNTRNPVQVEIIYAGTGSINPPWSFENPLTLSLRFAEYKNFSDNSSLPVTHVSYEFYELESVTSEYEEYFKIPAGTVCAGLPTEPLNVKLPDNFETTVHFSGLPNSVNAKLLYTQSLVAVSAPQVEKLVPIFNQKGVAEEVTHVVHDFKYGLEYHLASDTCVTVMHLSNDTSDVVIQDGFFKLKPAIDMFVPAGLNWTKMHETKSDDGPLTVFSALLTENRTIEVRVLKDTLYAVVIYTQSGNSTPTLFSSLMFHPASDLLFKNDFSSIQSAIHSCFSPAPNATVTMEIKDKSVASVLSAGPSAVSRSLETQINSVAAISPYRIHTSFAPSPSNDLSVIISLADPISVTASPIKGKVDESSVDAVLKVVNSTVTSGDWKIIVTTVKGTAEEWVVASGSVASFPPPPPPAPEPHFEGYTGGSMFVLAVFMLLIGAGIGAGGLFFVTKRQRISTLAYQVFE